MRVALLGPPRYYRPDPDEIRREGSPLAVMFSASLENTRALNAESLSAARSRSADVLFTHDIAGAEAALSQPRRAQVWLMLHSPMPLGLYSAWSWGIPEMDWRELLTLPDVRALIDREIDVCRRVDRLIVPCTEAFDELVRCDARFDSLRPRVSYVLTGAQRFRGSRPVSKAAARAQFGLPLDQPVGLFLGNREPYRGLDRLLAGLDATCDRRVVPGCVAVAGPDPQYVRGHSRVRPLGHVRDVATLFAAADFVINVNRFSLFDLSLIEAVEAGKPLLLHATGGNRTFLRLGAGCEMLPDLESSTIASGVEQMFTLSPAALTSHGERSRACYERHLTPATFRAAHERLYASAASTVSTT